jgi:hypothetical protein
LEAKRAYLERVIHLVRQLLHQARERLFKGIKGNARAQQAREIVRAEL